MRLTSYTDLLKRYYLRPHWPRAAALGVLLIAGIGLQLYSPQVMRRFIDSAVAGQPMETLYRIAFLFLGLAVASQVIGVLETYVAEDLGWRATNALRTDLARHCLGLDMAFHKAHTPGEMLERIDGDVAQLTNFLSRFVTNVLGSLLLLVGILLALYAVDWRIGGALTLFALVGTGALAAVQRLVMPHWKAQRAASAEWVGFLEERLAGAEDLRSCGAVGYVLSRFDPLLRNLMLKSRKAAVMGALMWSVALLFFVTGQALAAGMGAVLYFRGAATLGTVYLIFDYTLRLLGPIGQIARQTQDLQQATASMVRVRDLFATESALRDGGGSLPPTGPLSAELDQVSFAYEGEETVLHDVSFRVPEGQVLGLLGRTGSGKTTLSRLLFRLYDPQRGSVRLAGRDLRELRLADLRSRIGMVTQDVQLFQATVRDNLTLFDPTVPDERVLEVLEELGLGGWLRSLPAGLDTELESGGGGLSAGEAQLLALARVFLRDPGLVLLDEPSSRLDPATEALLQRAMDRLLRGRTGIVIAHRLATVQRADLILVLSEGRVLEQGPRQALAADPSSRFHHLLRSGLEEVLA